MKNTTSRPKLLSPWIQPDIRIPEDIIEQEKTQQPSPFQPVQPELPFDCPQSDQKQPDEKKSTYIVIDL